MSNLSEKDTVRIKPIQCFHLLHKQNYDSPGVQWTNKHKTITIRLKSILFDEWIFSAEIYLAWDS